MSEILDRVHKLLTLASRGEGEEARTAALIAAKMIVENNLLGEPPREPRSHEELREVVRGLLQAFLNFAWENRRRQHLLTVSGVIDQAIEEDILRPSERERGIVMLANLVTQARRQGLLVSVRGRYGGYRLAAGVKRSHAHQYG